jgi:hypothetical protein
LEQLICPVFDWNFPVSQAWQSAWPVAGCTLPKGQEEQLEDAVEAS